MSTKPLFQHRHYCEIAKIIAGLDDDIRDRVTDKFCFHLTGTNPQFSYARFVAAANGKPMDRDKRTTKHGS